MKKNKQQQYGLELAKEIVGQLDEAQLKEIIGGLNTEEDVDESCGATSCFSGTTVCQPQIDAFE